MAKTALYHKGQGVQASLTSFFRSVLEHDSVSAVMLPLRFPAGGVVRQTLVTDPEQIESIELFAPAFPMNAARLVSRLTRRASGKTVAVVLRPCEIRAYIELVKLKQGSMTDIITIGIDCPGAFTNSDYARFADGREDGGTDAFLKSALAGETRFEGDVELSVACKACVHPVPFGADLSVGIFGIDMEKGFLLHAETEKGEALFDALGLNPGETPEEREAAIERIVASRRGFRDEMLEVTREKVDSPEKLANYLSACINCYNCRVACPVCYCRECVFVTDVFDHDPYQYLRWALRKGKIRMPTDTVFYHMTRMAHMSTACVGCGQCANACPNDIPLLELFAMTAEDTQAAFEYEAGRSLSDEPPLAVFREDEFGEVVEKPH